MDELILKLRHDLANQLGTERTPAEVRDILTRTSALYDLVDLDIYRYMRDLGPGGCWAEARKQCMDLDEFFATRDLMLFVGERKYPAEPRRTDKPYLWREPDATD